MQTGELDGIAKDHREEILRESNLKNEVKVFDFDPNAPWFGYRGGSISNVYFLTESGGSVVAFTGGEVVELHVEAEASQEILQPIIGFYVKDRLGQQLFGDNTFLTYSERPVVVGAAEKLSAIFRFQMPFFPSGDYSVTVALAEGTQDNHVQHHWIDEALIFKVHSSHVARGLIGVPMLDIVLSQESSGSRLTAAS